MKWVKWVEIGFVIVFLLTGLLLALSNEYAVLQWFQTDDAFYYFKVAQNIGEGHGSTFDQVNLTNGYHPLWMLVCVPVFMLARFDLVLPLRVLILISSGLSAAGAVLLFRMLRRFIKTPLALAVMAVWSFFLPFYTVITMNGMEAALNAFFIILLWERVTALNRQDYVTVNQIWRVGIIAVFTFLSRLDNIFLVLFAGVWIWLRWWQPMDRVKMSWEAWRWRLKTGFAYFLPVTVALALYLAVNQWFFGTAMPVSGRVKVWWSTLGKTIYGSRLYTYPEYIFEYLLPADWGVGPWELVTRPLHSAAVGLWAQWGREFTLEPLVITYAVVFGLLAAVVLPGRRRAWALTRAFGLLPLFAATIFQSVYYFWQGSYHLREWYWVSQRLFLVLLLAVVLSVLFGYLQNIKYIQTARWVFAAAVAVLLVVGLLNFGVRRSYPGLEGVPHSYQVQAEKIDQLIPAGAVIAGVGTGTTGYFLPEHRVVNLDGLINSVDYLEHMRDGTVITFLEEMNVEYVFGNSYILLNELPYSKLIGPYLKLYAEYEDANRTFSIFKVVYPKSSEVPFTGLKKLVIAKNPF